MVRKIILIMICTMTAHAMENPTQEQKIAIEAIRMQLLNVCQKALPVIKKYTPENGAMLHGCTELALSQKLSFDILKSCYETLKTLVESINPRERRCGCRKYDSSLRHPPCSFRDQRAKAHLELEALLQKVRINKNMDTI